MKKLILSLVICLCFAQALIKPAFAIQSATITCKDRTVALSVKTFKLNAKVDSNTKLTYSVINPYTGKDDSNGVLKVNSKGVVTVKKCGVGRIFITSAANDDYYSATEGVMVWVKPSKMTFKSVTSPKKRTLKIVWNKAQGGITRYYPEISTSKSFKKNTIATWYKASKTSTTLSGLKSKKYYYVRIRANHTEQAQPLYGAWSKVIKIKVK